MLRQFAEPINVIVVSDLVVENEIIELVLTRKFSNQQVHITSFLLNAKDMNFLFNLKNCVIVVNHRLKNYINQLDISKKNIIIPISTDINSYDIKTIQNAVEYYLRENFLKINS